MNMTIMEHARSMRLHVGFPLQLWEDVVDIFVYLINKGPSISLDGRIPEEAWTVKKVNYSFLNTFGCESFVHIDKENRTNLEAKSKKCTFIGYNVNDFGYRLWDYENKKSLGVEIPYSMRRSCTKISCRERKKKKKNQNTQCLMRSLKKKFQRYQKIKMYNNMINKYLKLLQVLLEDLPS
jgi:hypothetical protein